MGFDHRRSRSAPFGKGDRPETILTNVHPGAIIVAHANGRGRHTAEALVLAIPKLKEKGYEFVTVSELLAAGKPVIAANTSTGPAPRRDWHAPAAARAMTSSPFSAPSIELPRARLVALEPASCASLAEAIVAMPPWSVVDYPAEAMARFLAASGEGASRYRVEAGGMEAGAVSIRFPWLKGPYLELLALLPRFQGQGLGASILAWFEREGLRLGARNLWVCAASFNPGALRFYGRHGFRPAATLPGLVADGYDEILLRKFPIAAGDQL